MKRRHFLLGLLAAPLARLLPIPGPASLVGGPTLLDLARRTQSTNMLPMIEVLNQRNKFLQDVVWKGPAKVGHRVTMGGNR